MRPIVKPNLLLLLLVALLTLTAAVAVANPPTLAPIPGDPFPTEAQPGHPYTFSLTYKEPKAGDPPAANKAKMIVASPQGSSITVQAPITGGDAKTGIPLTWNFTPQDAGPYKFSFDVTSSTGEETRFPASPADDYQFTSVSLVSKWVIFLVGLAIALLFLPFVVYLGTRSVNKNGNPAAAARVALMIGILAATGLFLSLFFTVYSPLVLALVGIGALGLLIVIVTRR